MKRKLAISKNVFELYAVIGLCSFLLLCSFGTLQAQHVIRGSLTEEDSGEVISGATIRLVQMNDSVLMTTTTDQLGKYSLRTSARGSFKLTVQYIGYASKETPVIIRAGQEQYIVDVTLK